MNKEKVEWIKAGDFFPLLMKRMKKFFVFAEVVSFLPGMFGIIFIIKWHVVNITIQTPILNIAAYIAVLALISTFLFFLFIVTTALFFYAFRDLKKRHEIDRYLLECDWCSSQFAYEIWKEIARYLTDNGIEFSIKKCDEPLSYLGDAYDIILEEKRIKISQYRYRNTGKKAVIWISIGILNPANNESVKFMKQLKKDIKGLMERMPEENPFCNRCDGKTKDICYGGTGVADRSKKTADDMRMFERMDPNKDKETLQYFIERKEKLGKNWYGNEDMEKMYEMARAAERYEIIETSDCLSEIR